MNSEEFIADEADTYRSKINTDLPPHLDTTSHAWGMVSSALTNYADTLESLQRQLSTLAQTASQQQGQVSGAQTAVSGAQSADTAHAQSVATAKAKLPAGQTLPPDTYTSQSSAASSDLSSAKAALQSTINAANTVHTQHDSAVSTCVNAINQAKGMRFVEPPNWWHRLTSSVGSWIKDHADILTKISGILKTISGIAGMLSFIPGMAAVALITGGAALLIDVSVMAATGKWSVTTLAMDAVGVIPGGSEAGGVIRETDAAASEGGRVAEAGVAAGSAGRSAAGDASSVESAGSRAASGSENEITSADSVAGRDTADAATSNKQEPGARNDCGDPIDVITGEMFMTQMDASLPGILPLNLRRVYVSGYRWGRLFGSGWASTLDQRLEVLADGTVCFLAEDGSVLFYPAAQAGESVLPIAGSRRWPLQTMGEGFQITDPESGTTRAFGAADGFGIARIESIVDRRGNAIRFGYDAEGLVRLVSHSGGYEVAVDTEHGVVTAIRLLAGPIGGATVPDSGILLKSFRYSGAGHLSAVVNSSGFASTFSHDDDGRIVGWVDRNNIWYNYMYDESGRCIRTSGRGRVLSYGFAYGLNKTTVTDSHGAVSVYEFNDLLQVTRFTDPLGNVTCSIWDEFDHLLLRTDPLGRTTQFTYDTAGMLTGVEYPDRSTTTVQRNGLGLPIRVVDPDGASTARTFDPAGNLLSVTDALGNTTSYGHARLGAISSVTDALGAVTSVASNDAGLPTQTVDPLGGRRSFGFDAFGRVMSTIDELGRVTVLLWSVEGKVLSRTNPDGGVQRWAWDGENNLTEHVDAAGGRTVVENGVFDLPVARTGPDGGSFLFAYDTELRLTSVANPDGLRWTYAYDAAGRVVSETDFNHRTLTYGYDAAGQLTSLVNGLGEETRYGYDIVGDLTSKSSEDGEVAFRYDLVGRLLSSSAPNVEVDFQRDRLGRVLAETVNGRTVASGFDPAGRRVSRLTPAGIASDWSFDSVGRPLAVTTAGERIDFRFDAAGREIARRFAAGAVLEQSFDPGNRLIAQTMTAAGLGPEALATAVEDPMSTTALEPVTLGVDLSVALPAGAPERVDGLGGGSTASAAGRVVVSRAFAYRLDGVLTGVSDLVSGASRRFDLDGSGRVSAVHGGNWTETYAYARNGSITAANLNTAGPGAGAADAGGSAGAWGGRDYAGTLITKAGDVTYGHDRQGRVVTRSRRQLSRKPLLWHYTYDSDDRMTSAISSEGQHWIYRYDPFGRRIAKQQLDNAGNVVEQTEFVWDGSRMIEETHHTVGTRATDRTTTWEYLPGSYRPISQAVSSGLGLPSQEMIDTGTGLNIPGDRSFPGQASVDDPSRLDTEFYAIVTDMVGTPTELVSPDGRRILWSANERTLWGTPRRADPKARNSSASKEGGYCPLRFAGQYADDETGLNYNHHRYYDPESARFTSTDPLGLRPADDPHSYVLNPTGWIDPSGLTPCEDEASGLVYRGGSRTSDNLTPRPEVDESGLSTFDSVESGGFKPGSKVQVIDTSKLGKVRATPDAPPVGHVSIGPVDKADIPEWAATRGSGVTHPYTKEILDAIVDEIRVPK